MSKGPWLGKAAIGLGLLLMVSLGLGYLGLREYLHSDAFRKFLSAKVSGAAEVDGNFAKFSWDGLAVDTAGFDAAGEGLIAEIHADEISTEVGFGGVTRGIWEIKNTSITRLELVFNADKKPALPPSAPVETESKAAKKQPSWVPDEVELESLAIGELALSGMIILRPRGGRWDGGACGAGCWSQVLQRRNQWRLS